MQKKVSIQGIKGSFHHQVAIDYFGEGIDIDYCSSFVEIPERLVANESQWGVMAIENTLVGSILPNYTLIDKFNLCIHGEYHLPIHLQLMVDGDQTIDELKEVWSHPMALLQCRDFFRDYPHIKLIETSDTAKAAQRIYQEKIQGVGAIANCTASDIYNLNIIASEIQTRKKNFTRFFILNNQPNIEQTKINKASLKFVTNHQVVSLSQVLTIFADFGMNLSKIQSIPLIDEPWEYAFFADIVFDDEKKYRKALQKVKSIVQKVKTLGEYRKGKRKL